MTDRQPFETSPFNLEADAQNRLRALDVNSFIVEAPAGAGKTELLTQRYLKLLKTVNAPEEIIAITFTNKAAAEMRLRILDSLLRAEKQEVPAEEHKKITYQLSLEALQHAASKQWQLIENPSSMRIFTIDSLCSHLARQMPLMSRFGSQPRVAMDASDLYAQAAEQTLLLLEDDAHGGVVKAALRYVDNDANQIKNLLIKMLEKRDQWIHHAQQEVDAAQLQATLNYLVEQQLQQISEIFSTRLQFDLQPLARFAAGQVPEEHPIALLKDWGSPLPADADALPMWLAVRELLLTKDNGIRARIDKNIGFPPESKNEKADFKAFLESLELVPDFADTLGSTKKLPSISVNPDNWQPDNWQIVTTLSALLKLAVAQLWLVFQRAGEVDFVEISQRATKALADEFGEPTELALKLDYRIQHLLVDEFQDTSPSQIALLKQLTSGWQPGDGRTLFAVGDPMQSIYRFRKANVGLFIEAAENGIGDIRLERLQLYRNNRSCPPVVDWINDTFKNIFPSADNVTQGAIHYRPFIATKHDANEAGVEVHPVIRQADTPTDKAGLLEVEVVVDLIQCERSKNPGNKIAVLVRSKKHLASLVTQLRREHKDIQFQAVEIEALEGRQIVQDLLALTHALYHRADRVHWLSVLRAPWCGLTLHDLNKLAGHDHRSTIWSLMQNDEVTNQLTSDGQARLKHVKAIFEEAFIGQGRVGASRWIRGVWLMLNGTACLWEQSDVVDVQAFFTCLDGLDRSNQFSPERLETEITKLFAAPDSQGEHLQMMTIHKSKGLEFDTVILLGLGAAIGGNNSDKPLVLWEEVAVDGEYELLAAPYAPKSARDNDKVSPYDFLEGREKERDSNEAARVLYVAATRAERKLHLVGTASLNAKGEISPAKNTFLDLLWPAVVQAYESASFSDVDLQAESDISTFTPRLVRLQQLEIPAILQLDKVITTLDKPNAKPDSSISIDADIGTLAHRYMEIIAQQGLGVWPESRLQSLKPAMQHWFRQQGHSMDVAAGAAETVSHLLATTFNSQEGQWVLAARESAGVELAMVNVLGEEVKKHIIDRTFVEGDVRWIIDYKTADLPLDASWKVLESEAENYRAQLEGYASLFENTGHAVKCAVFFMRIGRLVPLQ